MDNQKRSLANKAGLLSAMGAALLNMPDLGIAIGGHKRPKEIEGKPCLNCGKLKHHNNSFCSGECCNEYRGRAKNDKV